jgi:GntR family transcriptional regulator
MLLEIDHHSGQPIYRQVIDQIRQQIMAGQLREGEQLVTVRDLAGQLRVNPMTISKAYALLEVEGLLERRRGIGLFVAQIRGGKKEMAKEKILEEALRQAAVLAVQFEIPQSKASDMLAELYEQYNSKSRDRKNG